MSAIRGRASILAMALALCVCDAEAQRSRSAGDAASFCLSAAELSRTLGFEVRVFAGGTRAVGPAEICAYEATGRLQGTLVTLSVGPAGGEEDPLERVQRAAKTMLGARAEAERIDVGDVGYAYGSNTQSEAAARKGDRAYYVQVVTMGAGGPGSRQAELVALLRRVVD